MNPQLTINTITKTHEPIRMLQTIRNSSLGGAIKTPTPVFNKKTGDAVLVAGGEPNTNAVMAGGAIYDLYTGQAIKDYDIFIKLSNGAIDEDTIAAAMQIPGNGSQMFGEAFIEEVVTRTGYELSPHVDQVWNVEHGVYTYQLIFLTMDPIDYIEKHFDFGICKAYCDGRKIRYTIECLKDINEKTITICDGGFKQMQFDYILKNHLARVRRKYPSHQLVLHPNLLKLINDKNRKYITGAASPGQII